MTDLFWFEWERPLEGYTVEKLCPEYFQLEIHGIRQPVTPDTVDSLVADSWYPNVVLTKEAPQWACDYHKDIGFNFDFIQERVYSDMDIRRVVFIPVGTESIKIQPLTESPGMFMEFAEVSSSKNKITKLRNFLSKYGTLDNYPTKEMNTGKYIIDENTNLWIYSSEIMHKMVCAWKNGNSRSLIKMWDRHMVDVFDMFKPSAAPQFELGVEGTPVLRFSPVNLSSALFLQFAHSVSGNKNFRACEACSNWIEVTPGAGRPEKLYCSDACRMRAYRKRKKGSGK